MKKLTLMKRITDLRDDFIEDAYLPEAVPVLPVKPRRTIPVLGIPFAMAGKIAAASLAGIAVIGVVLGIAIPALRDMEPTMEETPAISDVPSDKIDTDDPYEDTDPSFNDEDSNFMFESSAVIRVMPILLMELAVSSGIIVRSIWIWLHFDCSRLHRTLFFQPLEDL